MLYVYMRADTKIYIHVYNYISIYIWLYIEDKCPQYPCQLAAIIEPSAGLLLCLILILMRNHDDSKWSEVKQCQTC